MGASSTHRSLSSETGTDTVRFLYEVERLPERRFFELPDGFKGETIPWLHQVAVEGNRSDGALRSSDELLRSGAEIRELIAATFGIRADRGTSRLDVTTSRRFEPVEGRAFMAGLAAMEFPRLEATRRGTPPHSVWWTGAKSATIKQRVYCESFKRAGRLPFERLRLEAQQRFPSGHRPPLEVAADPEFQRAAFLRRFQPMRKAVDGVRAASFPVLAQAIADEARYGYREVREAERLAGALVLLTGGAGEAYTRATRYRRRKELQDAGYVVVDDFMEPVEVDLADELDRALEEFGG